MVIEALKAARDFIENDRQALAESLTVNGEIVFEDDIDRGAMAEYVNVLAVIDKALESTQAQESPFHIGQRLRQEGGGISDLWGAVGSDADMPEAQRGFDEVMRLPPVQPVQEPEHIIHSNGRYSPLLTRMMNKRVESNVKQVIHLYDDPPAQPTERTGQAPCARHCEATAFQIVIKNLRGEIDRLKAAQPAHDNNESLESRTAQPAQEPVDSMGMPLSCGKPLCAPGDHHPLCKLATHPAQPAPVQDAEGENKAVRSFLMLYGQPGLTVGQMKKHMARSGFRSWPEWVETEPHGAHLTKAGAQLWIRHLFALEVAPPAQPAPVQEPVRSMSDEQDAFEKVFKLPDGITRFDGGYAPTSYSAWSAQQQCYRWEGWKARMGLATPPAAQPAPKKGNTP